jgi:hypothetical protein
VIVYSANIGHKDRFHEPTIKHEGVEYVYFVDNLDDPLFRDFHEDSIWDVREVPKKYNDTRMDAKWYKMHPHLLFPGEETIWCDSLYFPHRESPLLNEHHISADVTAYHHNTNRKCLFDEAAFCLSHRVGNADDIKRQIAAYREEGMPEQFGLFEGNVIYRKPEASKFSESWWEQVNTHSTRDQISMPYVIWKNGIDFLGVTATAKKARFFKGGRHLFHGTKEY